MRSSGLTRFNDCFVSTTVNESKTVKWTIQMFILERHNQLKILEMQFSQFSTFLLSNRLQLLTQFIFELINFLHRKKFRFEEYVNEPGSSVVTRSSVSGNRTLPTKNAYILKRRQTIFKHSFLFRGIRKLPKKRR